jgi:K+-sensing histidine kinase KdpD
MLKWMLPARAQRHAALYAADRAAGAAVASGFVLPIVVSMLAVLLTTAVLFFIRSHLAAQHLVLGYLLPTVFIAVYFGSTIAVLAAFASGLAAAYFLFPPVFSFYIADSLHIAELFFFMLLAVVASKAVGVLTDDDRRPGSRAATGKHGHDGGWSRS